VALAEACLGGPYAADTLGARVTLSAPPALPAEAVLYGEDAGRVVASCDAAKVQELLALTGERGVPAAIIGRVESPGGALELGLPGRGARYAWPTRELRRIYFDALPRRMNVEA
jgi:hypothetical protein